jgi:hypothetical protein
MRMTRSRPWWLVGAAALATLGCDGGEVENMGSHAPFAGCATSLSAPPAALGLAG